ncbi:MAG: hypothetical protein H0U19_03045, partial [Acidobacteria bacterium]|nr:hypothetical protein [Acidobacteriota bacterium]
MLDGGVVRISTSASVARLTLVVENPCDQDRPKGTGGGVGLANVHSRLRALYGTEASVRVSEEGGRWRVELSLPAERASGRDGRPSEIV